MNTDNHGQVTVSVDELFWALYADKKPILRHVNIVPDDLPEITQYNNSVIENADKLDLIPIYSEFTGTTQEFDKIHTNTWFMPHTYQQLDIAEWLITRCKTDAELDRVAQELELFIQHDMIGILQYLKYLVDSMRKNKIVWGVGRGSSVASYCLYLIGIHKIDSIKYKIDISEFIR